MSAIDGGLRKLLRDSLPRPDWLWTPVESGGTHGGIPDTYWTHGPSRTQGWIECKKTTGWAVEMRPHQIAWLSQHASAGVRCHILVRASGAGSAGGRGDSLWLLRGEAAGRLAELGLQSVPAPDVLGWWMGSPRCWDFPEIAQILLA